MGKRTASNVDEEFLINSVHMRTKGGVPFQRQAPVEEDKEQSVQETPADAGNALASQDQDALSETQTPSTSSRNKREPSPRRSSTSGCDYDQLFLVRNELRFRKAAYLSVANHDDISRIVKELGNGQLSVGGYLDLIVTAHLEQYRDRINALYRAKKTTDELI